MAHDAPAYGLWSLAVINIAVFAVFAFSFTRPRTARLQSSYPGVDWLSHDAGHLLEILFGWRANPHFGPFHVLSFLLIGGGFMLLARAWNVLYMAQRTHTLATTGPYARIRHPQYVAFILIMLGFLLQWPTLLTLAMFPILVWMYVRLARREEREVRTEFGEAYARYAEATPAFIPRRGGSPMRGRA